MSGDDTGAADPQLAAALGAWASDRAPATARAVHAVLLDARLLVAVVPVLVPEQADAGTGSCSKRATEMGLATLTARGRSALPAFTGLESLARWRPDARPVPVPGARLFAAARAEGHDAVVVDPAGPVPFVVRGEDLDALASGYLPVDDRLAARLTEAGGIKAPDGAVWPAAVATALRADPDVAAAYLLDLDGETVVGVELRDDAAPAPLAHRLSETLVEPITIVPLPGELLAMARAVGVPLPAPAP